MQNELFLPLLARFGESLGLEGLCLDEQQSCTLGIDDVMLNLQLKEDTLFVYALVGNLEDVADASALCRYLLEANCLGADTAGFTLGLLPGLGSLILSGQLAVTGLTLEQLTACITLFVEQAEAWTKNIRDYIPAAGSSEPETFTGTMLRI